MSLLAKDTKLAMQAALRQMQLTREGLGCLLLFAAGGQ